MSDSLLLTDIIETPKSNHTRHLLSDFPEGGSCALNKGGVIPPKHDKYFQVHKNFSELETELDKAQARKNLGIDRVFRWGNIAGNVEDQLDLTQYITELVAQAGSAVDIEELKAQLADLLNYTNDAYPSITTIKEALDTLLYKELEINFTVSPSVMEKGMGTALLQYKWSFSKSNIEYIIFNGKYLDVEERGIELEGKFEEPITATLEVSDGVKTYVKTVSVNFYVPVYYGVSEDYSQNYYFTSVPYKDNRLLQGSRNCTVTVTAGENEYIWFAIPTSYGTPTFTVNGFDGGFFLDYVEEYMGHEYNVYRSDYPNLGTTTIKVS